ncbi:efflux RND transporter periplasmic adaptor subunit [Thalassospira sp.]|uniref:efflux RND transporter periplasmic adaptor subunit n=1 Tax=Thalassospira sp. TaxID=1912094 RepID=UPI002733CF17|nr:efflux RND transporter periplasmic adaptor subunit [Thalassospira sp.]MDP2699523.1 efflux RND transporter periplasmic adaptor subunit [Thalassospira sp.]
MSRAGRLVLISGLIVAGIGGWLVYSGQTGLLTGGTGSDEAGSNGAKNAASAGLPVIAEYASMVRNDTVIEAVGTGKSALGVSIFPAVRGEVSDVLFNAGDEVVRGQVLVILDSAREKLARDLAAVQLQDTRQMLARYEQARPLGAVSDSEVDNARTALAEARIRLDQAEVDLADRSILAPFDGVVGISAIETGDRVDDATQITTLDYIKNILVDFEISETRFADVRPGQALRVETWSLPGEIFEGTVAAIGSRVDPQSRTFSVRASVPNPDDRLRPGMSFAVYLELAGKSYPSVPEISVLWGDGGTYVWQIDENDAVSRVPVRVVKRTGGRILIDGPVAEGDLIVVEGVQRLRPGRTVSAAIRGEAAGQPGVVRRNDDTGEGL